VSIYLWATIAADLDIPKETIAAALGHRSGSVTDIYINFNRKKIDAANRQVLDHLFYANCTSENSPKAPFSGYVGKNQPFLIIFNYTIGLFPIIVCLNHSQNSTNLEILRNVLLGIELHKIQDYSYFEQIQSS